MLLASLVSSLLVSVWITEGFIMNDIYGTPSRSVTKTLSVDNGRRWGYWRQADFCPDGAYAVGYNMKIEEYQFFNDDTMLNGIELICETPSGLTSGYPIRSGEGDFGSWFPEVTSCDRQGGQIHFLTSFALQVEEDQGSATDDTAANYVKFHCNTLTGNETEFVLARPPGQGSIGTYGLWSETCDDGTAICGLQTRVEYPQGNGDDTALNDVKMFCCS